LLFAQLQYLSRSKNVLDDAVEKLITGACIEMQHHANFDDSWPKP